MKICNKCNIPKEESEFDVKKDGLVLLYCKDCRREKIREHYRNNKEYYKKKGRKSNDKCIRKFIKYKESLFCTDCKLSFRDKHSLCDFHHLDPNNKDFNISQIRNSRNIQTELSKCIPLCANCHRLRHQIEDSLAKLDTASEYESEEIQVRIL